MTPREALAIAESILPRREVVDALRSAVEDQERLNEVERHVIAGREFSYAPYAQRVDVVEYDGDDGPSFIGRGPDLRTALDAARTPGKENDRG